jgi:hypothetical protein
MCLVWNRRGREGEREREGERHIFFLTLACPPQPAGGMVVVVLLVGLTPAKMEMCRKSGRK